MHLLFFLGAILIISSAFSMTAGANIVGPTDDRGSLTELGPRLGLSPDEIEQARGATGYVYCPGQEHGNGTTGSGALVSSNRTIVTAVHLFIDQQGRKRQPWSRCFFQTQSEPHLKAYLDPAHIVFRTDDPYAKSERAYDWAVARLVSPIHSAKPYRPIEPWMGIAANTRIISIAALAKGFESNRKVPIVQECTIKNVADVHYSRSVYSDCDASRGMSGSIILTRHAGELMAAGITIGGGLKDRAPYNFAGGDDASFAQHTELSQDFAHALKRLVNPE